MSNSPWNKNFNPSDYAASRKMKFSSESIGTSLAVNAHFLDAVEECFAQPSDAIVPLASLLSMLLASERYVGRFSDQDICEFLVEMQKAALSEDMWSKWRRATKEIIADESDEDTSDS
jgi:hypothetical protein